MNPFLKINPRSVHAGLKITNCSNSNELYVPYVKLCLFKIRKIAFPTYSNQNWLMYSADNNHGIFELFVLHSY